MPILLLTVITSRYLFRNSSAVVTDKLSSTLSQLTLPDMSSSCSLVVFSSTFTASLLAQPDLCSTLRLGRHLERRIEGITSRPNLPPYTKNCSSRKSIDVLDNVRIMYRRRYLSKTYEYDLFSLASMKNSVTKLNDNVDVCTIDHLASISAYRDSCFEADSKRYK